MTQPDFGQITVRLQVSSTYLGDFESPRTILVAKPDKIGGKVDDWLARAIKGALERHERWEENRQAMMAARKNGRSRSGDYKLPRETVVPPNYRGD